MKPPFEELLREFMAGRMSTKQGNAKIMAALKRSFRDGLQWASYRPQWRNTNTEWKLYSKRAAASTKGSLMIVDGLPVREGDLEGK